MLRFLAVVFILSCMFAILCGVDYIYVSERAVGERGLDDPITWYLLTHGCMDAIRDGVVTIKTNTNIEIPTTLMRTTDAEGTAYWIYAGRVHPSSPYMYAGSTYYLKIHNESAVEVVTPGWRHIFEANTSQYFDGTWFFNNWFVYSPRLDAVLAMTPYYDSAPRNTSVMLYVSGEKRLETVGVISVLDCYNQKVLVYCKNNETGNTVLAEYDLNGALLEVTEPAPDYYLVGDWKISASILTDYARATMRLSENYGVHIAYYAVNAYYPVGLMDVRGDLIITTTLDIDITTAKLQKWSVPRVVPEDFLLFYRGLFGSGNTIGVASASPVTVAELQVADAMFWDGEQLHIVNPSPLWSVSYSAVDFTLTVRLAHVSGEVLEAEFAISASPPKVFVSAVSHYLWGVRISSERQTPAVVTDLWGNLVWAGTLNAGDNILYLPDGWYVLRTPSGEQGFIVTGLLLDVLRSNLLPYFAYVLNKNWVWFAMYGTAALLVTLFFGRRWVWLVLAGFFIMCTGLIFVNLINTTTMLSLAIPVF